VPVGYTPKGSFVVRLESTDLNLGKQSCLVFQKVEFRQWGFSIFEFRPIESFCYIGRGI